MKTEEFVKKIKEIHKEVKTTLKKVIDKNKEIYR